MVLQKINQLGLTDKIELKNTLEVPEHKNFHQTTTGRTTVPCLYIDGKPMFESGDICDWLVANQSSITKSS
jgi:hypothetical protein